MCKNVSGYLAKLKKELGQSADPALIQDALSDAETHLRNAVEEELFKNPGASETEILTRLIEKYGTPGEIAAAYLAMEPHISPAPAPSSRPDKRPPLGKFFGVLAESRSWGAFVYLLFAFIPGILFGGWTLFAGLASASSLLLIIGLPLFGGYLVSIRGIALLEGRIIEALIGVRMPRKPVFLRRNLNWRQKYKALITESYTWKIFAYLILHFPLGIGYVLIILTLLSLSIKCIFYPVWFWAFGRPLITINQPFYPHAWAFPLIVAMGIIILFSTLHLTRLIGSIHGRFAKSMLVRKQEQIHQGNSS